METSPTANASSPTAEIRINDHTPCHGCGYDLQSLRVGEPCPECSRAAPDPRRRIQSDSLVHAPPRYIQRIGSGFWFMAAGVTLLVAATIALAGLGSLIVWYQHAGQMPPTIVPAMQSLVTIRTGLALLLIASLIWFAGVWMISAPLPPVGATDRARASRWGRITFWARLTQGCLPGAAFVALLGSMLTFGAPFAATIFLASWLALLLVGVAGWWPTGLLCAEHADWAHDEDLARQIRCAVFGLGLCVLVILVGHLLPLGLGGALFMLWGWMVYAGAALLLVSFFVSTFRLARLSAAAVRLRDGMLQRDLRRVERLNARAAAAPEGPEESDGGSSYSPTL